MNAGALHLHPEADIVPPMTPDEYDAFLTDVLDRGITTPLTVTSDGVVLDGRHRLGAAITLGIEALPVHVVDVAPDRQASLPEWARAWRCADCGSRPAAEPVPMLGDLGRAPCPACGAARYFRRAA